MTEITTAAELEALPVGVKVTDCDGDEWQKLRDGWAITYSETSVGEVSLPSRRVAEFGPLKLADTPELHSTRCCGSDSCTATTPLPPGSTWLCSAHSNLLPGGGTR